MTAGALEATTDHLDAAGKVRRAAAALRDRTTIHVVMAAMITSASLSACAAGPGSAGSILLQGAENAHAEWTYRQWHADAHQQDRQDGHD